MAEKNRNKLNFYIDIVMFLVMGALIGIGILIRYVLLPGQKQWLVYGDNMELTFWGLDRHEWGTIHLVLGGLLFVLLILHIIFHWRTIKCFFRRYIATLSGRSVVAVVTLVLFILLAAFPVFVTPEKEPLDRGEGRRMLENMNVEINDSIRIKLKKSKKLESGDLEMEIERGKPKSEMDIRGTMTLEEVVKTYGVPLLRLKKELGIPEDVAASERVGRLKKRYDFTMGDVKTVVMEHGRTRER
jgi:hypothetical protein